MEKVKIKLRSFSMLEGAKGIPGEEIEVDAAVAAQMIEGGGAFRVSAPGAAEPVMAAEPVAAEPEPPKRKK